MSQATLRADDPSSSARLGAAPTPSVRGHERGRAALSGALHPRRRHLCLARRMARHGWLGRRLRELSQLAALLCVGRRRRPASAQPSSSGKRSPASSRTTVKSTASSTPTTTGCITASRPSTSTISGWPTPNWEPDRARALRFAGFYTGDDPAAANWDAEKRMIRSPITGSRGPRFVNSWEDWATHRWVLAEYPVPFDDLDVPTEMKPWSRRERAQGGLEPTTRSTPRFWRRSTSARCAVTCRSI